MLVVSPTHNDPWNVSLQPVSLGRRQHLQDPPPPRDPCYQIFALSRSAGDHLCLTFRQVTLGCKARSQRRTDPGCLSSSAAAFQPVFTFPDFLFHGPSGPRAVAPSSFLSHPLPSLECQGRPSVQIVPSPPFWVHIPELPGL